MTTTLTVPNSTARGRCAVVVLLGWLLASGCSTDQPATKPQTSAGQPPVDWKADLARQRDQAEANVRLARTAFPARPLELTEAQTRYARVRTTMNLLIEDIQSSIREDRNPSVSAFYSSRSREAEEALLQFNRYVESKAVPPDQQPKFWPVALPIISSLGSLVWDKYVALRARSAERRKAALERVASDLNSVRFVDFSEISTKP